MNLYANLTQIKARLNITATGDNTALLELLGAGSRAIDQYCQRRFYVKTETRYFDGSASPIFLDDLIAITTFKLDEDGNGTYESTLTATTDYHLYPLNAWPKTHAVVAVNGSYGGFASGMPKGVEIVGSFGYGDGEDGTPYSDSTTTTSEELDASETGVDVGSGTVFAIGQTILIESEQMYITGIASNTLTVVRGVNGTTAATHATGKTIYIYDYPEPIREATLIQAMRWWKRKDSAFQDVVGLPEIGQIVAYKGLDADIREIIARYRKRRLY